MPKIYNMRNTIPVLQIERIGFHHMPVVGFSNYLTILPLLISLVIQNNRYLVRTYIRQVYRSWLLKAMRTMKMPQINSPSLNLDLGREIIQPLKTTGGFDFLYFYLSSYLKEKSLWELMIIVDNIKKTLENLTTDR